MMTETTDRTPPDWSRSTSSLDNLGRNIIMPSKRHSTPPELPPREKRKSRRSWLPGYSMEDPTRPSIPYSLESHTKDQRQSVSHNEHDFEDIPLEDIKAKSQEDLPDPNPEPTRRNIRDSLNRFSNRISLTPSDIPYPAPLFTRHRSLDDPYKAEYILGLRPPGPPRVPPKDPPITPSDTTSTPSLPSYNKPLPPRPSPPLNGRTAWLHALSATLIVGNCWGLSNAFGLFQAYYTRYYLPGTPPSTIAWIGSTQFALVFGLGVPVGRLVDIGFFRHMFHGGTLLMVLGLFASSWCKAFWSLWLAQGLLTGFGMGMVFCSGILALMSWFDERKMGLAMGLGAAGSCIGGIVYVLLARHFLAAQGFATTMRVLGGVAAATMIPPNLIFRMRDQRHLNQPRSQQLTSAKPKTSLRLSTFTSPAYLSAALGMFLTFLGVYFGFVYIVSYASTVLHLSDTSSTNLLIFMLLANLPGRFVPALISDKCIGPLNTIIPAAFLSSAVIWLWAASSAHPNQASLTVVACFYGFVSAGVQVLYAPTVYTFCLEPASADGEARQLATDKMGVKAGGIFSCIGVACLVGTPIGGALVSRRVNKGLEQPYLGAQVFAGSCLLVGGIFLLLSRVAKIGWAAKRA
jgi:predicted MFS family arabinose efflux permease